MTDAPPRTPPPTTPGTTVGQPTVELVGVSKTYGEVVALNDVTVRFTSGMTAVLGPNGAGKSTLLRLVCGLTHPTVGQVRVLGRDPRRALGHIALVPQHEALPDALDARRWLATLAALDGHPDPAAAAAEALAAVQLDPTDRRPLRAYSRGMRQRVRIAQALLADAEVLVLDEPLTGLDPRQRQHAIGLFRELAAEGRTVLVSSHVLAEVARFGSRVVLLAAGRLLAEGDAAAIRELLDDLPRRVRVRTDRPHAVAAALITEGAADAVSISDGTVEVETLDVVRLRRTVAQLARRCDARLFEFLPLDEDLESLFRDLVGGGR